MRRCNILLLAVAIGLSGCSLPGPVDDGFDDNGDPEKSGGGFVLFSNEGKNKKDSASEDEKPATDDVEYNTDAPTDYQSYQSWRKARDGDSGEYERFRRWQEFEEFLQWKESQK